MARKKPKKIELKAFEIEIVNINEDVTMAISDECCSTPPDTLFPPTPPYPATPTLLRHCYAVDEDDDDGPRTKRRKTQELSSSKNNETTFVCEICCVDDKSADESFGVQNCSHSYCKDCINSYVASKLQMNITTINCPVPDCKGSLDPDHCRRILPPQVAERWESALRDETMISLTFSCPYKDCSTTLSIEDVTLEAGKESECPSCKRMLCARCKVPWQTEIGCEEFQKLNEDEREEEDLLPRNLAKKESWDRQDRVRN